MTPIDLIHTLNLNDIPDAVKEQAKLSILDLIGIGAGGAGTRLSAIIREPAAQEFGGTIPMLFDGRTASAQGAALAAGITIDSLDGHDGFNMAKGHIGAPLFPAILALGYEQQISGREVLLATILGYEFGARVAMAQHATAPDYHTSGSWGAVTAAAAGAYILQLNTDQTRHALGIAEYHGPRSQMMRCIDHPTMLKDGAGWGAMAGVSAAKLAQAGFTGAPALIVEEAPEFWQDLGERWYMLEQYYKPYPVCRWAQAPIEAALHLQRTHGFTHHDVTGLEIETFHEAIRLATSAPETTEQAQYSTSYPVAVALVHGDVTPDAIADDALGDPDVMRLSHMLVMREQDHANAHFPTRRYARAKITLRDGQVLESDWMEPKWDHRTPATAGELTNKFRALAHPVLGPDRATRIETAVNGLEHIELSELTNQLLKPTNQH